MAAPWPLCLIAVPTSLLDPLWLHPGGPVWDPFLVHFGDGFGTHFGAHLERLNYPVEEQEGIRKLRRSVSQPGKLPLHASQVFIIFILELRNRRGDVLLRKLDGSLRTQLELTR